MFVGNLYLKDKRIHFNVLEELKEKYSHWIAMSGDYSRENRDPFIAVAELILFTY